MTVTTLAPPVVAVAEKPQLTMPSTPPLAIPEKVRIELVEELSDERTKFQLLLVLALASIGLSFVFATPVELASGMWTIFTSPSGLFTDYFELASIGATLLDAGVLALLGLVVIRKLRVPITGMLVAGIFTVFGFAFFGKNLFNSLPIPLGVLLYSRLVKKPFADSIPASLFGTALAPTVSYLAFGEGFALWFGIPLGYLVGLLIGMVIPPMAAYFSKLHLGLSLYNVGFTAGLVGMVIVGVLNVLDLDVQSTSMFSHGHDLSLGLITYAASALMFIVGVRRNGGSTKGLISFFRHPGRKVDFIAHQGLGRTLMNMGIMGALATTYVLVVGGELNGPVLGAVYTIIGFAAIGKHPLNSLPIIGGVALAALVTGTDLGSNGAVVAALFGTTLAPVAGVFGPWFGLIAGFLQMSLVSNVGFLHGGLNLYNSGFTAGFVAIVLIPFADAVYRIRGKEHPPLDL